MNTETRQALLPVRDASKGPSGSAVSQCFSPRTLVNSGNVSDSKFEIVKMKGRYGFFFCTKREEHWRG